MHIHKDKLEKALAMLGEGKSTREVAKTVGLSFSQLKQVARLSGVYVEVKEYGRRLERLRSERKAELERLERLDELIRRRETEVKSLQAEEEAIICSLLEEAEVFMKFVDGLVAALEKAREDLDGLVGPLYTFAGKPEPVVQGWVSQEKWERVRQISREWRERLDKTIPFLKSQRSRLQSTVQALKGSAKT
jgi:DNA repair exonuclease SbcCD ATPase subunit